MRVWRRAMRGCKFLIIRRDATVPAWPAFVIGARDAAAPAALRKYAAEARSLGYDAQYCADVDDIAREFEEYRAKHGQGNPSDGPHRVDHEGVIDLMEGEGPRIVEVTPDPKEAT
jgi:hypothetical protein